MSAGELQVLAPGESEGLGRRVAEAVGVGLSPVVDRVFEDGEHKMGPGVSVRGGDVYVVQSLHGEADLSGNDKLVRLLFLIGAVRDAGAERVTAVAPYLCYTRKEKKTKAGDPVTTRYVAQLFEAVGGDRVVTVDVHDVAAYQNSFRCRAEHLTARRLMVEHFAPLVERGERVVVVSPDAGGVKRAEALRRALELRCGVEIGSGFMEKYRSDAQLTGRTLVGDVKGATVVVPDDLIASGATLRRAAEACRAEGAAAVHAAATHGLFVADAEEQIGAEALESVAVTDTVEAAGLKERGLGEKVTVLPAAGLVGEAVRRMHDGTPLGVLSDPGEEEVGA